MNKIFKVVWSKSKNCYVVVSEFAKNNSGKKKIVVAAILAALAMTNASISMAANTLPTKLHATAVGLGDGASVTGDKAVGFGQNAAAAGGYSIAIGSNSSTSVNSPQGIAIGGGNTANEGARVIGEQAIAIGGNTIAQGNSSIVIGGDDVVKADGVKVIYTTNNGEIQTGDLRSAVQSLTGFDMRNPLYTTATAGESGITLGMKGQSGNVGIAIGTGANAKDRLSGPSGQANNDVTNAIAIGTGARANRDNAIAIGGGSNTDVGGTKQSSYTLPNNVVASWAGGDKTLPGDVVSFGSKGYERQLKHVAPGEVSATSTDAINGSQLSAIVDQIAYKYISIKSSDAANKDNTGATADNSIAIGPNAATDASASRSVAVGDGARGKVVDGVAVGSKSIADIASGVAGYNVNASRTDIYAGLSGAALTSKLGGVAVGTINQTRQINYVAAGTADTDAVNVAQLKSVNLAFTGDTGTGDVNLANSKLAVNGDNTYISTTANGKKITVSGKKQDITVANGSATATAGMADSANVANAINQAIDQNKYGWNLSANGEATPVAVEKGNTVDFSGDDNVAVARNDKKISVALKKDLSKLNSASFNNASGNETVKIDGDKGINAGNLKVANVADGVADKDAVNVSQLKKVDDKAEANKTAIGTNKTAIAKNVGDIATNKTDIATNKDSIAANTQKIVDNKTAIDKNTGEIATNKANIAQNTAAIARKISLGGNSGSTDEKSLSTGDVKFNVKGENGLTTVANGDDVTVKLDDATKGKVDNAADRDLSNLTPDGKQQVKDLAAWNVVANNETAEKVVGGNTVKFIDGDNISITQNGKDFTISTKKDVTFDTVTAIQTITAPKVKATTGVETPQVTGLTNTAWVPGQTQPVSGRAATEDQLKQVDDQVADNKANIADNTDKIGKNADAIADNKQKIADNKTAIDKNIGDIATNKADIATNKANIDKNMTAIARKISLGGNSGSTDEKSLSTGDVKFNVKGENGLTTVANGDDVTVKLDDATKGKVDNAADRDLSNLTDAGKQQVKDLAAWHVVANNETAEKVEGGNTVKFIDGDNISITQNGKDFTISTKKDVTFDTVTATQTITAPKVKATTGVETPQVTGLTNTAWTPGQTQPVSGRAATEDQLKHVDDQVAENKANIADNTDKIGKNADAIADNKQKIADNKTAIDKNAVDIATNKDNIATNKADIAANTDKIGKNADAIADNKQKIADNKTAIDKNTGDIATNKGDIAANKQKIADNKTAIDKNTGDIATNKADIATNKDNIATNKANIDKNTTAIGRKISLGGNSGSTDEKSLSTGDVKFNVKGENGLTTVANGDDVTVKLDDATKSKVDNAADRDLSNLTPDGKQQIKDLAAWNVVANNETAEKVEGGNTVKFIDGDNISITQNGKDFTISTKKDVTFDTVTATQTITAPKVKATTGVETPQVTGLTNIAWVSGQTQPVSGRAATEDQLKQVDDQVAENKANIADNTDKIGKNADAIADNKQKIADNKTAIDRNTSDIATNKGDIAQNTAAIARKISLGGNSGLTDEKSLSTGDVKFNVKGENGLTTVANGDDVTVKLDDATKGKIDNAADRDLSNLTSDGKQQVKDLAAWNVVANNEMAEKVEGGNTVKFIDGDNISITQNGKDFTISTKKDVTFDTVTANQTITAPKVKATTGVETPQVTGLTNTAWVPGQTQPVSGRAATEDQLKHVDDQVAENKANIAANETDIATNKDNIADNKQKIADNKSAIDKNTGDITTNKDNIADNKQKIADNKTAIDKNTADIATNKGDIASNKSNIAQNTAAIARKISLGGNSGSTNEKSLSTGDVKFNVKGENGLTTVANGDDVTVKLDDATKGKVDNAADRDLSNLTDTGKQQVKDLAVWNVVANNETAEKVEGGNTVKFIDGDNISITQNGKDFTISTKKDVTFDTVTATQTITAPKVKATTGVETPQVIGLTNTAWTPGQTQPVSGRAATEDQLKHVDDQVAENKVNIADNTDKIGKNADAIADNKQKIADNKTAIDKNAVDIATNKDNIAANKADIATNKDNIADNKQKIADNKSAIDKNTGDIATNKDNIAKNKDNIDKNTTAIARKISLGGNSGSTNEKSLSTGDVKFNVKGENGLTTVANGDDVTVKLDDATKGKVDNAADRDLSNLTPDGKQQVKDIAAWNVVANNETAEKVEGGNTVKFIDGDNISITQNGKDFTVSTKKDVTFDTVAANQTITAPKVKATTGVETPQVTGLTNTAWTPSQTQPVSGRAATEDQLKHVDDQVAENKANIADNTDKIGKNAEAIADNKQKIADNKAAIDKNAADIATNRDNIATNKQNIADNKAAITKNAGDIATNKANIDKNTEAIGRKISLGGNTGSTDEKSLSTGDVKFNIKGQNGIVTEANGDDVTVKLDDATANKINNAANTDLSNLTDAGKQQVKDLSAWNVVANGNTAEKVEGGNTVKFIDGDNISITQNGKDFTIATKQDVTFNTVKANQTITAPKVKATEGVETPQVTGLTNTAWTPGQTQPVSGRAATEDQLKHVDDQVAENKANIADNIDKIGKNADAIADNKQKIANNKAAIDRNAADIATNKDNIAANKQNIADNKAAITKNTSDIATNKDNIATNKANINKNTTAIARKISLGGNTGSTDEKSLSTGDVKFNVKGENGLTTVANGDDVTVKLDDATKGKIDNAANQDLSNLTDAGKQQVKDISAWKVTAAGGTVEKVQGGDTVKFQAGDNLVVNQDRTTFTYGLAKDLKGLNSVTVGDENGVSTKITPAGTTVKDAAGNSTTINGGGMTITPADAAAGPVSLTVDGLNNGGKKIHGVAPGTADTDAVNVSQLKASNAGLQEAVNRVGTETQRVGAHAAAMAALKPIQYDPLEPTQIMAGIGNYRGETAGAIGIAHYRTEDTMFNVGVSLGTSHNMVNAGVTHKFGGSRERKDAIPERYKAGPISSVYVMQDEVSSLKKENSNQKTVIANQAARLNTLEAENERQRQELAETKQGLDDLRAVVNQLLASKG
ncbi:MAG: ESPR-type extended signal peptide-containing protein [Veillonella parvula]|uniref:ESPR-type extended signal peptide-containing protein n=1 Tax=Veillonella parvula TaxID=29466 RepID=UPI002914221C|nr:ESPR-type extended signal peptide-containing protein [Veillonella parvula]MDU5586778.1 ESPR-type extended signal peptide-containing protein [Veillonella parvula]